MFKDYYKILGVEFETEPAKIKEAYRDLALKNHPDSNPGDKDAHKRFLELGEAYQVLSDPDERRKYDHKYVLHYKISHPGTNSFPRLEMTRQKRASRYQRGRYSQRVRYRGSSFGGATQTRREREEKSSNQNHRSEAYYKHMTDQAEMDMVGFFYMARVLRFVAVLILIFTLGMTVDYFFASKTAREPILYQKAKPKEFGQPKMITLQTSSSLFHIPEMYKNYLPIGEMVQVEKTPIGRVPTRVFVRDIYKERKFKTTGGIYNNSFPSLIVIIFLTVATLWVRHNPETVTYLGAITLILSVILLAIIFK